MVYYPMTPWTGLAEWENIKGKPYITVSAKGIANGLSDIPNDGADFGPDTPETKTNGIMEAKDALPKIVNPNTKRKVPIGTIVIKFGGYPIQISSPLIFYDDEFVSLISYDGLDLPIQPGNTPVVYITNTTSPNIITIYPNPTVPASAGNDLGNGFLKFDGLTLMNTIASPSSSPQTIFNFAPNPAGGTCRPNPSQVKIGQLGIYDKTASNALAGIITNGADDNIEIDNLIAIGGTGSAYNMVGIRVNHLVAKMIHIFSISYTSVTPNLCAGFMFGITPGGNTNIDVLDTFSYFANGVLAIAPPYPSGLTGAKVNIGTYYDETSGVQNNAKNCNNQKLSSSFRATTIINNLSAFGQAFQAMDGYGQYLEIQSGLVSFLSNSTNGTTAGTVSMYAVYWSPLLRKYVITFSGYENSTTTDQTINFPMPYSSYAVITANNTGLTVSASTTGITITSPNNTTTYSGIVIVEGY